MVTVNWSRPADHRGWAGIDTVSKDPGYRASEAYATS